jgi:hypothetical protein
MKRLIYEQCNINNKAVVLNLHSDIVFWHLSRGRIIKIQNLPTLLKAGA